MHSHHPLVPTFAVRAAALLLAAAVPVLQGCASQQPASWRGASVRDQHAYMPVQVAQEQPLIRYAAGPTGAVINLGDSQPATRLADGGAIRYVQVLGPGRMAAPKAADLQQVSAR